MSSLQELLSQRAELERQIEATQRQERGDAISKVKALMVEYGLSVDDFASKSRGSGSAHISAGSKVAPKFRNSETGETWSGRGLRPRWLKAALEAGKSESDFAI